jgi:hypothetical protein
MKKLNIFLSYFVCQLLTFQAFGQEITKYFHQVEQIASSCPVASCIYKKLDSLKNTHRPTDSRIELYFDRDVDFGYKHQRINITLNGLHYQLNLLTRNDTVYLSSTVLENSFYQAPSLSQFNDFKIT